MLEGTTVYFVSQESVCWYTDIQNKNH